ncbi:Clp protease ClpP [Pseudomonas monteilii]|uniref:Clp protease ClpP n=1 Tax=Pseudomonas monteilii TaxID=76759 RepID=A0A7X3F0V7_9PSED|nr:ClpP-like prohead protease/major capsid protein fusion protein [Pseudomonas monteilii]MVF49291.1 Clp protease ClpP [Pseudomonas monteilii]
MDLQIYDVIDAATAQMVKATVVGQMPITVQINSPGGSVTDALAIYAVLRKHTGRVTAIVDGLCASAATLVALAADEIVMAEHSLMMVHNPWTVASGDADEMRKTADTLDVASREMTALYTERTGLSAEKITAIMGAETWFNSYEAVDAGFAHRVDNSERSKPRMAATAMAFIERVIQTPEAATRCRQRLDNSREAHHTHRLKMLNFLTAGFESHEGVQRIKASKEFMSYSTKQAGEAILAALGADTTPCNVQSAYSTPGYVSNGNIVRDGMVDALTTRLGLAQAQDNRNPFRTMTLAEMARASLTERGVGVSGYGSKMQLVGAAFTHMSSDFGNVLMDVSGKAMLRGWEASGETFQRWTKKGSLSNFHPARRVGISGFPTLPKVPEGAEYKYVTCNDRGAPIALATYGGLFSITRQAIINDDLSAFSTLPAHLGRSASRTIGDLVYSVLTTNAAFVDGKPLFGADHGNTDESAAAMSPVILGELRRKMRLQKDDFDTALNISPAFVIVPAGLESAAMQVLNSSSVPGADYNSGIANPVNKMGELIVESRLDRVATPYWYVAAEQGADTIEVAYLDGVDTPYLEEQEGWTVDGVSLKVRIDAGVAPLDYRGLARAKVKTGS